MQCLYMIYILVIEATPQLKWLWLALAATVYLQVNVHTNVQMWLSTTETQVNHVWCTFSNLLGSTVTCCYTLLYNY